MKLSTSSLAALGLLALVSADANPQGVAPSSSTLFQLSVSDATSENGKKLNMTFRELEREANWSLVEVTFTSGGSVASSMFILRGMCGVMRSRAEHYFTSTPIGNRASQYRMNFPRVASEQELRGQPKKVFAEANCSLLGF